MYPQSHNNVHCHAGDVLGSFLDLDNGLCTFFINGCDLGLTVEFEHPTRQHRPSEQHQNEEDENIAVSPMLPPPPSFNSNNNSNSEEQTEARANTNNSSEKSTTSRNPSSSKSTSSLGLYPAVSLTTHQHILLNFGDRPWIYPPPVSVKYKGISEAGKLDEHFKNRVIKYVQKRNKPRCKSQATVSTTASSTITAATTTTTKSTNNNTSSTLTSIQQQLAQSQSIPRSSLTPSEAIETDILSSSSSSDSSYDWDGPLCTICFSEPKNVMLLPCRHTGWGERCADALDMWYAFP